MGLIHPLPHWQWRSAIRHTLCSLFLPLVEADGDGVAPISHFVIPHVDCLGTDLMTIQARLLEDKRGPMSMIRIHPGRAYDLTLAVSDNENGQKVDWTGHQPRFRIHSQTVDQAVVMEITDPEKCTFESDGIWRLRLTAEETASLPRGGMLFTLEHSDGQDDGQSDYQLGVTGGISCVELRTDGPHANAGLRGQTGTHARS